MRTGITFFAVVSLLMMGMLALLPPTPAQAQDQSFSLNITPEEGTPGTTVTLEGTGAPPDHLIQIYYAGYQDLSQCRAARGAAGVIETYSDGSGRFSTTAQVPQPPTNNTLGVSFRAEIAPNAGFSNYRCFAFPAGQLARYFPETDHEIDGRFLEYWQQNGGLGVFGYPLTAERVEESRVVQYLERTRLEYAPSNPPPYDVLLGRIGAEIMEQEGLDWREMPAGDGPEEGCLYFEATNHNVCNQLAAQGVGFLNYWQSNGLEFDGQPGHSYEESLALFGLPLTEPYDYAVEGELVQVQWFERARFEWHPDNPAGFRVLLGRLGAKLLNGQTTPDQPPQVSQTQLYFIALGDAGASGREIGCGDSVIPVTINIEPTIAPLTAAFERLLATDEEYYGQSGLYNALHNSDLTIDSATVENGQAIVYLSGNLEVAGTCEGPRIEAQIRQTADQFSTVSESVVYINGERLENIVSLRN
jgi:enamine deaminase RidA (YjgF/YER057c/UK114 family)